MEKPVKNKNPFLQLLDEMLVYKVQIIVTTIITLIFGGSIYFYNSHRTAVEISAHTDFIEYLEFYNAKVNDGKKDKDSLEDIDSFDTQKGKWAKVAQVFAEGYEKNQSSSLASMFLVYESEAYINLGEPIKAVMTLRRALDLKMPAELQQAYLVKLALMQIDLRNSKGLELLTAFSDEYNFAEMANKLGFNVSNGYKNFVHDYALFRLGEYHWLHKDFSQARSYWNQLDLKYGKATSSPSVWAPKASERLKLIEGK